MIFKISAEQMLLWAFQQLKQSGAKSCRVANNESIKDSEEKQEAFYNEIMSIIQHIRKHNTTCN